MKINYYGAEKPKARPGQPSFESLGMQHLPLIQIEYLPADLQTIQSLLSPGRAVLISSQNTFRSLSQNPHSPLEQFFRGFSPEGLFFIGSGSRDCLAEYRMDFSRFRSFPNALAFLDYSDTSDSLTDLLHLSAEQPLPMISEHYQTQKRHYRSYALYRTSTRRIPQFSDLISDSDTCLHVFTSPSTVRSMLDNLGLHHLAGIIGPCIAIGGTTASALVHAGAGNIHLSSPESLLYDLERMKNKYVKSQLP